MHLNWGTRSYYKIASLTTCKAMTVVRSVGETSEYEKVEEFLLLLDLHI